jgi:hypothetical protein
MIEKELVAASPEPLSLSLLAKGESVQPPHRNAP